MKRLLRVLKIIALGILGLIVIIIISLLIFYHSIYKATPLPAETAVAVNLQSSPNSGKPVLLPLPKTITWTGGHFSLSDHFRFQASADDVRFIRKVFVDHLNMAAENQSGAPILFKRNVSMGSQSYSLSILPARIIMEY
ncbi:MAG TPA: hypothetical protein VGH64_12500, partial [Puia sp.]